MFNCLRQPVSMFRGELSSLLCSAEAEVRQRQGRQSLGPDPGAAFRGAGLVGPGSRSHTLFPVGAGLERRACAHEEAPPTLVPQRGPACRRAPGRSQAAGRGGRPWGAVSVASPSVRCCFHRDSWGASESSDAGRPGRKRMWGKAGLPCVILDAV